MGFPLVPKSVTPNNPERRNGSYYYFVISPNLVALRANYVRFVEVRSTLYATKM